MSEWAGFYIPRCLPDSLPNAPFDFVEDEILQISVWSPIVEHSLSLTRPWDPYQHPWCDDIAVTSHAWWDAFGQALLWGLCIYGIYKWTSVQAITKLSKMRAWTQSSRSYISGLRTRHMSNFVKFEHYLSARRDQAEKSILVQISEPEVGLELKSYLISQFGPVKNIFHYSYPVKGRQQSQTTNGSQNGELHWILAEFDQKNQVDDALRSSRHVEGSLPYQSPMLWFSSSLTKGKSRLDIKHNMLKSSSEIQHEKLGKITEQTDLKNVKTLSEQLTFLESAAKLTELGVRIRFVIAHQLERSLERFFPLGCVLPFGSTVSGIGRQTGDLDLVLLTDKSEIFREVDYPDSKQQSRLWYQSKLQLSGSSSNARFQLQRVMETTADVIQLFMPGCTHVQRILQARVPILRFWSDFTDIQCDLSMMSSSGVHMSELIYLMAAIDDRFRTLVFAIRSWASSRKITNPVPGRQPTNFMFVLLLMHFLQNKKILPSLDVLFNNARKEDFRMTADGIECSFLRDPNLILKVFTPQTQKESLAELLFEFFEFYSEFDFNTKGVSVITGGSSWGKPDSGPMYIQNPLERHLNVARNVSREEVARLKSECCSALWKLETSLSGKKPLTLSDLLLSSQTTKNLDTRFTMKDLLME